MDRRTFFRSTGATLAAAVLPINATFAASGRQIGISATALDFHPSLTPMRGFHGQDVSCERALIEGKIPHDLRGTFYRNGPGLFERGGARYEHWFDGDGLLNAWQFTDKGVSHRARFVQTKKFIAEQNANEFLLPAFGSSIKAKIQVRSNDDMNTANTNVVRLGDKLLAMWEGGSATALDPETLDTRGPVTWTPELKSMPFSAHPKVEADGTFWNFGTLMGKMVIYHISAKGELLRHAVFDMPSIGMVHDFTVSQRHIVFVLPPIGIDYQAMRNGKGIGQAMTWDANAPTKILVVDKSDFGKRRIIELPAHMVYHFGNAWEENNIIRVDYVKSDSLSIMNEWMPKLMRGERTPPDRSHPAFLRIDLNRGRAELTTRDEDVEFPRIDPRFVAKRNRSIYYPCGDEQSGLGLNGIMRLDTDTGKTDRFSFGDGASLEEHVFVPKRGSQREGEGYLIGVGFDVKRQQSFGTVFDGGNLAAGPMAIIRLPYWMPTCFHGNFYST